MDIIKIGGSIFSDKMVEKSYDEAALEGIFMVLAASNFKGIILHGGGSWGHPPLLQNDREVGHKNMVELTRKIQQTAAKCGLDLPSVRYDKSATGQLTRGVIEPKEVTGSDAVMVHLCKRLQPQRVLFLSDACLFDTEKKPIAELQNNISFARKNHDATGGIAAKVAAARSCAAMGAIVHISHGVPNVLQKWLAGDNCVPTRIMPA